MTIEENLLIEPRNFILTFNSHNKGYENKSDRN